MDAFHRLLTVEHRAAVICGVGVPTGADSHAHNQLAWDEAALPFRRPVDGWLLRAARSCESGATLWTCDDALPRAFTRADRRADPSRSVTHDAAATPLRDRLLRFASVVRGTPGRVIGHVTFSGFDTHHDQAARHATLLAELSEALAAFQHRLDASGTAPRVLTLAYSEVGRSLSENKQGGTEHGPLSVALAMGDAVEGPLHGAWSARRAGAPALDFRRIHATLARHWLGCASAGPPAAVRPLPFIRSQYRFTPPGNAALIDA